MGAGKICNTNNLLYNIVSVKLRKILQYLELREPQIESWGRSKEKDMIPDQGRLGWEIWEQRGQKKIHGRGNIPNRP